MRSSNRGETVLGVVWGLIAFGVFFIVTVLLGLPFFSWGVTGNATPNTWLGHALGVMAGTVALILVGLIILTLLCWIVVALIRRH